MLAALTAFVISMPLLAHAAYVWQLVGSAWGATVLPVRVLGLAAVGALLGAFLTGSLVPALWRRLAAALAIVVLVGIALYQVGAMAGAHQAFKAEAEKALQVERKRAEKAEVITTIIANQAATDLA
ncbi:hypothetical protein, partial [Klebsiella pneumoniae]|uniref:hypothetical protein n=1 Tax=Klebsiella pneumoniae TaxID=573 RepID=UPI003562F131